MSKTSFHLCFDLEYRFISQYKKRSWFQCPYSQPRDFDVSHWTFPLCYGSMWPGEPPKTRLSRIQTRSFGQDFRIQFPFGVPVGWRRLGSFCRKTHVCKDCSTQSWLSSTGYLLLCNQYGACDVIAFFQLFLVGWLFFFSMWCLKWEACSLILTFDPVLGL